LTNPEEATKREKLIVDSARAGDFVRYEDEHAAKVSFTIDAFSQAEVIVFSNVQCDYIDD